MPIPCTRVIEGVECGKPAAGRNPLNLQPRCAECLNQLYHPTRRHGGFTKVDHVETAIATPDPGQGETDA